MKFRNTLKIPKCWKELAKVVFPDNLAGLTSGDHHLKGIGDPTPYYDDFRQAEINFPDGMVFELTLASGQSNYFVSYAWKKKDILTSEISDDRIDTQYHFWNDGHSYHIDIEWM